MAYFYTVTTVGAQPNFTDVAKKHGIALNNYLEYGVASELDGFGIQSGRMKLAKKKEVEHMSSTEVMNNNNIYLTTILCCEDDEV